MCKVGYEYALILAVFMLPVCILVANAVYFHGVEMLRWYWKSKQATSLPDYSDKSTLMYAHMLRLYGALTLFFAYWALVYYGLSCKGAI